MGGGGLDNLRETRGWGERMRARRADREDSGNDNWKTKEKRWKDESRALRRVEEREREREREEEEFWPGGRRTGGEDEGRRKKEPRNTTVIAVVQ